VKLFVVGWGWRRCVKCRRYRLAPLRQMSPVTVVVVCRVRVRGRVQGAIDSFFARIEVFSLCDGVEGVAYNVGWQHCAKCQLSLWVVGARVSSPPLPGQTERCTARAGRPTNMQGLSSRRCGEESPETEGEKRWRRWHDRTCNACDRIASNCSDTLKVGFFVGTIAPIRPWEARGHPRCSGVVFGMKARNGTEQ
jgi:hypothetical protein